MIKWMKHLAGAAALSGLCMAAHANTTVSEAAAPMQQAMAPAPAAPAPNSPASVVDPFSRTPAVVNPTPVPALRQIRIAILLPTRSPSLGKVASSVLDGIKAGYEREPDRISIQTIDTDGSPQDTVRGYEEAVAHNDIVIGPLSRSEVNAIAQAKTAVQPTIVFAPKESDGPPLPAHMLPIGLSVEDEARQVADWVDAVPPPPVPTPVPDLGDPVRPVPTTHGPIFTVASDVAWQKRAAKAFAAQMALHGVVTEQVDLPMIDGYLSAEDLISLKKKIQKENPPMLFVGFDARLAAQLRLAIGDDLPIYGTSQLNPRTPFDWKTMEPIPEMNGMRLVDIPWQLEPDHPAVMVYPQIIDPPDERHGPVVERVYALGIDAYRIAREIALDRTSFALDGVTGKLIVNFGRADGGTFERTEQPAVYRNGMIVPADAKP